MPEVISFFCEKDPGEFLYSPALDYLSDPIFDPGGIEAGGESIQGASDAEAKSGEKTAAAQKAG
ncbi:MAG: hypothetical protein HY795_12750 [Desulfovibrio sp.]|nr:hypothetical protein [Desulfovibrio sp.]MBI4959145.1 hypothetical protein [Desulfovibrio sp.]